MFGRVQRGVSSRPKKPNKPAIPIWAWVIVSILFASCMVAAMFIFFKPWEPVATTSHPNVGAHVEEEDTNQDFRFYDLLPQQQVTPIPDQAVPESTTSEPVRIIEAPQNSSEDDAIAGLIDEVEQEKTPRFILQVRSYQDPDSADARRAEIILNGLSADIVQSNEGGQIWYRVISGPYESQEAAIIAQQTLQNSGIDSIVVKQ